MRLRVACGSRTGSARCLRGLFRISNRCLKSCRGCRGCFSIGRCGPNGSLKSWWGGHWNMKALLWFSQHGKLSGTVHYCDLTIYATGKILRLQHNSITTTFMWLFILIELITWMFLVALVCLSVCKQHCSKKIINELQWNFMEGSGTMKNWLNFGGNLSLLRWVNEPKTP